MNKIKSYILPALFLALVSGCSDIDDNAQKSSTPGKVAGFTSDITTRAANDSWSEGDEIGIRMIDLDENTVDTYFNEKYTVPADGVTANFEPAGDDMLYPLNGDIVNFVAYYPYTIALQLDDYAVDVSDQSALEDIDLLWAKTSTGYDKYDGDRGTIVPLTFEHMLTKLELNVADPELIGSTITKDELIGMVVSVTGVHTLADFNIVDGLLDNYSQVQDILPKEVAPAAGCAASYQAILLPATVALDEMAVTFSLAGSDDVYTWKVPAGTTFAPGKRNVYKISLMRDAVSAEGTIRNWEDGVTDGTGMAE